LSNSLSVAREPVEIGALNNGDRWARAGINRKKDFAVRWSGILIAPKDGKYFFGFGVADGGNIYIDNKKVITNDGLRKRPKYISRTLYLKRGQHRFRLEFFEKVSNNGKNDWEKGSVQIEVKQVGKGVKKRRPYPLGNHACVLKTKYPAPAGFKEEIFYSGVKGLKIPDLNAKKADVQRVVPRVTYGATKGNWRGFTKKDNFAVRWSGFLSITKPGPYKFSVRSNDGSKLFVGRRLLVNNDGVRSGMVNVEGTMTMRIRTYPLILEYFEKGGPSPSKR